MATAEELIAFSKDRLAAYKKKKGIEDGPEQSAAEKAIDKATDLALKQGEKQIDKIATGLPPSTAGEGSASPGCAPSPNVSSAAFAAAGRRWACLIRCRSTTRC